MKDSDIVRQMMHMYQFVLKDDNNLLSLGYLEVIDLQKQ